MDTVSLAIILIVITLAASLIGFVMASYRKEKGLWVVAAGFAASSAGLLMVLLQQSQQVWVRTVFGVLLANLLIVGQFVGIAFGIRLQNGDVPAWPRRFHYYLAAWLFFLLVFTLVVPSYQARVVLLSLVGVSLIVEFHLSVRKTFPQIPNIIRHASRSTVAGFVGFSLLRILWVLTDMQSPTLLSANLITSVTLLVNAFFVILWLGLILILDGDTMMREMNRRNNLLQQLASLDELTGLLNRNQLDTMLQQEMERMDRYQTPLCAIMIDLDHFKDVNDTHGHRIGDEILKQTARLLAKGLRENDRLFRWGGEEFLLLVPYTDEQAARMLSERLRQQVEAQAHPVAGVVTASFGVARRQREEPRDLWFDHMDQAMYHAKHNGRNRVEVWHED